MNRKLYQHLASLLGAIQNCIKSGNSEWEGKHSATLAAFVREFMPSGSGIDSGTTLIFEVSSPDRLVFRADFHHMNAGGYYDGWTEHSVIVTPSLQFGIVLRITGKDRDHKDYMHERFDVALNREISRAEHCRMCGVPDDSKEVQS